MLSFKTMLFSLLFFPTCLRFVNVLVYYGLSLNISDFGMNIYLTQMIFGLVEMPARTITLFTLNRSRKISQLAFLAVGGTACLLTIFIPSGMDTHVIDWEITMLWEPNGSESLLSLVTFLILSTYIFRAYLF